MSDKILYGVSYGSYSDYTVVAMFSTREKAQDFIDTMNRSEWDEMRIEEFTLDPNTADLVLRGYSAWLILMLRDGTVERIDSNAISMYHLETEFWVWRRTKAPLYRGKGIPDCLNATVLAKTSTQAIKIANEHRAQLIANGDWEATNE